MYTRISMYLSDGENMWKKNTDYNYVGKHIFNTHMRGKLNGLGMWLSWHDVASGLPDHSAWDTLIARTAGFVWPHYYYIKCQVWDVGFRPNSLLQATWDTSIARAPGFMWHLIIVKRQLWDQGFRRNSFLQPAWDTSITRAAWDTSITHVLWVSCDFILIIKMPPWDRGFRGNSFLPAT